jgi:hypothetical protein
LSSRTGTCRLTACRRSIAQDLEHAENFWLQSVTKHLVQYSM